VQLTDRQAKQLRVAHGFRTSSPTLLWYIKSHWRAYLYLICVGALAIGFFAWADWPTASAFSAGLVLATLWRDIRWYNQFVEGWPLTNEITNWDRVDELLAETVRHEP
jgi:hypothetical protein